ncbi:MAG: H-NS histone family protein [Acidovorax sp.]|nr:H-NS histone family protein [Acidovorax sp.]
MGPDAQAAAEPAGDLRAPGTERANVPVHLQRLRQGERNPETGDAWTGRGKEPVWIRGLAREAFLITAA